MRYLILVLNDSLNHIESAALLSEPEVDLWCYEVLSPSLAASPEVSPARPATPGSPPPLSPVFPPSPPAPLGNPETELALLQYRRELLERNLIRTAEAAARAACPCERQAQPADEWLDAVNLLFPDCWLESSEEGHDIFRSPSLSPESWIDMSSYDSDVEEMSSHFSLDCPEEPGRECSSCGFHRSQTGTPGILCSLCYMRQTYHCIYSEFFLERNLRFWLLFGDYMGGVIQCDRNLIACFSGPVSEEEA
ncbi:E1A [reindeer adenovirus 1]|uniref:E1A n=1 Tax=reindeer adenovirus 1 TaxID=2885353 RepID=A0AAE9C1R0_9ADEN|nr:E1A [reindeer adenovirus 1]